MAVSAAPAPSAAAQYAALLPGAAVCLAVTAIAAALAYAEAALFGRAWVETLVLAILVGTLVRSLWTPPARLQKGIAFCAKQVLEFAVVLLGASISAATVIAAGVPLMISVAAVVVIALLAGFAIGRALKLPARMATLIACGNAICGNSAIAAVAPLIGASAADVAASIAFTAVLGVVTVLTLPLLGEALHMSQLQYGTLAGLTVYAVPQVLAATVPMGMVAVQVGTLVKLVRVLMLGPVCLVLSLIMYRAAAGGVGGKTAAKLTFSRMVPWFIIGFLGMMALRSLGLIPQAVLAPIGFAATALTILAMAALGLGVDIRVVGRAGGRVTAAVTCSLLLLLVVSFTLVRLLGIA